MEKEMRDCLFKHSWCRRVIISAIGVIILHSTYNHILKQRIPLFPRSKAMKCSELYDSTIFAEMSESLNHEETILHDTYFKGLCGGSYVELGAHDGKGQDNTLSFHNMLHWSGLLIEASPSRFERLKANRPHDTLVNAAICNSPGHVHFIDVEYVGGIYELMNQDFIDFWHPSVDVSSLPTITCSTFESIAKQVDTFFDFLSLDVEGGEYHILQTLGSIEFGVIFVESDGSNPKKDNAVRSFLNERGYLFDGKHNNSQWFVNKNWHHIYKDVIY